MQRVNYNVSENVCTFPVVRYFIFMPYMVPEIILSTNHSSGSLRNPAFSHPSTLRMCLAQIVTAAPVAWLATATRLAHMCSFTLVVVTLSDLETMADFFSGMIFIGFIQARNLRFLFICFHRILCRKWTSLHRMFDRFASETRLGAFLSCRNIEQ